MTNRALIRLLALSSLVACLLGCGRRVSTDARDTGELLSQVQYVVDVRAPARSFRSRLGQTITLESAYLTYASVGLGRCAPTPPSPPDVRRGALWWRQVFGIPLARAGHDGVLDHAFASDGWVLDLLAPTRGRTLAERYFPPTAYCRVQTVVAGAHESFDGYPAGRRIQGDSLYVRGNVTGAGAPTPFAFATDLPYGKLFEFSAPASSHGAGTRITIVHDLRTALEHIDVTSADVEQTAKRLLRALIDGAQTSCTRIASH